MKYLSGNVAVHSSNLNEIINHHDSMDLDASHEIPIEEPLEVVVAQEVAVETNPILHIQAPDDGVTGNHGDQQPVVIHIHDQQILSVAESSSDISSIQQELSIEVQTSSSDDVEREWKDSGKRLRDMMKKRALRQDTEYRKKECVKAKERMANRRNDPAYREQERQKDRERRAQARRNKAVREKERQRDVQYKRKKHATMKQKFDESGKCRDNEDGGLNDRTSSVDCDRVSCFQEAKFESGKCQSNEDSDLNGRTKTSSVDCDRVCIQDTCTNVQTEQSEHPMYSQEQISSLYPGVTVLRPCK